MAKMTISIPDAMSDYVSSQVSSGEYGDASDYISHLLRREQQRREQQRSEAAQELSRMLDDDAASGVSPRRVPEIMNDVEAKMRADGRL